MNATTRRKELSAFLRARRAALQPDASGLPRGGRRLTPGLRREEVAMLAGVGITWYTWLEQGREINASRAALERIAQALQLAPSDTDYLLSLGREGDGEDGSIEAIDIDPPLQTFLDSIGTSAAMVMNPRFDVLAYNRLADRLFDFGGHESDFAHNHIWRLFFDPARRAVYAELEKHTPNVIGVLRANYAAHLGDREFEALITELRGSPEFVALWDAHATAPFDYSGAPSMLTPRDMPKISVYTLRLLLPKPVGCFIAAFVPADEAAKAAFIAA